MNPRDFNDPSRHTGAPPPPRSRANPPSSSLVPAPRTDAEGSVPLGSGLHFSSLPGRCLTCPGLSSSHDPCVCPRDQRFHLRKSVSLNIGVLQPRKKLHGYAGAESGQLGEVRGCWPLPAQPWLPPRPTKHPVSPRDALIITCRYFECVLRCCVFSR